MKFKLDENLPAEIKVDLNAAGHGADTVVEEGLGGASDSQILSQANLEGRVLLTMDKGIADVRTYPPEQFAGIVLLRPTTQGRSATLSFVRRHLPQLLASDLAGRLIIVSESGIRVR